MWPASKKYLLAPNPQQLFLLYPNIKRGNSGSVGSSYCRDVNCRGLQRWPPGSLGDQRKVNKMPCVKSAIQIFGSYFLMVSQGRFS